jgi:hypothetical protein
VTVDEITLELPRERTFYRVAHLVLGGLAVRLNLTFEHLEDLQLALAGLLDRPDGDGEITLRLRVEDGQLHASVGPFDGAELESALRAEPGDGPGLRRLLDTVVDGVEVAEGDGGRWVELRKHVGEGG